MLLNLDERSRFGGVFFPVNFVKMYGLYDELRFYIDASCFTTAPTSSEDPCQMNFFYFGNLIAFSLQQLQDHVRIC